VGFVIAVDGPAASGKGVIAGVLGRAYGFPVLDSGLLYRAVALALLRGDSDLDDPAAAGAVAAGLNLNDVSDPALRSLQVGEATSRVSVHPEVRQALMAFQRAFAAREPGAVIDGRDIGTVIAPDAPAKLFVTAKPEVRARRRWLQLQAQSGDAGYDDVLADILRRDERDSSRAASPLARAPDAVLLDTTEMTIDQAADAARRIVEAARVRWEQSQKG
jgi:cytidylate kinase